jgi:hypothetical protein
VTSKEKLEKIRELVQNTHSRFGYYSCREYMSQSFKEEILNIVDGEDKKDGN